MALPDYNKFGFISGFNTMVALITLVHRWPETVDREGGYLQSQVTDYRKAYDLINHNILYGKLQNRS